MTSEEQITKDLYEKVHIPAWILSGADEFIPHKSWEDFTSLFPRTHEVLLDISSNLDTLLKMEYIIDLKTYFKKMLFDSELSISEIKYIYSDRNEYYIELAKLLPLLK